MAEVKMTATKISNAVFSMEVIIWRSASGFAENVISYRSSEYELCDGMWTLVIFRENKNIHCRFEKAGRFVEHFKGVIIRKSIQINGGDLEFHLPDELFVVKKGNVFDFGTSWFWLKIAGKRDCVKITCLITCLRCRKEIKGKEILPQWILNVYKNKSLEGKHQEETGEFSGSKLKLPSSSGVDALRDDKKVSRSRVENRHVIIKVKDHEFRIWKSILRKKSPVFCRMLSHNVNESNTETIHITDCEPSDFKHFLDYLRSGKMKVSKGTVFNLYYIGDKFKVDEVQEICRKFMSKYLTVETFCEIVRLALQHKDPALLGESAKFFVKKRREITVTDQWISFLREDPVTGNDLYTYSVYDAQRFQMT